MLWLLVCVACLVVTSLSLKNGVGLTPVMGFNTWNGFRCRISEETIKEITNALTVTGLKDAGYNYVNIDDCWSEQNRNPETNELVADRQRFPNGIKALTDELHSMGFKVGIYSDIGTQTCAKYPGSYGFEQIDANTFAKWGIDYLKHDSCHKPYELYHRTAYVTMRDALLSATQTMDRSIVYSLCNWGVGNPARWPGKTIGNSWRISNDLWPYWNISDQIKFGKYKRSSILDILDLATDLWDTAEPGAFNDLDMLVVGFYDGMTRIEKNVENEQSIIGGLTFEQQKTHFAMWCLLNSPLLIGYDIREYVSPTTPTQEQRATQVLWLLKHSQLLRIHQDTLGAPAQRIKIIGKNFYNSVHIWCKKLIDPQSIIVAALNRGSHLKKIEIPLRWISDHSQLNLRWRDIKSVDIFDIWNDRKLISRVQHSITDVEIEPFAVVIYELRLVRSEAIKDGATSQYSIAGVSVTTQVQCLILGMICAVAMVCFKYANRLPKLKV